MARLWKGFVLCIAVCAIVAGVSTAVEARRPPGGPGRCECAPLDNPVVCSDGKTYANPCVAACFGAMDCVPTGGGGIP